MRVLIVMFILANTLVLCGCKSGLNDRKGKSIVTDTGSKTDGVSENMAAEGEIGASNGQGQSGSSHVPTGSDEPESGSVDNGTAPEIVGELFYLYGTPSPEQKAVVQDWVDCGKLKYTIETCKAYKGTNCSVDQAGALVGPDGEECKCYLVKAKNDDLQYWGLLSTEFALSNINSRCITLDQESLFMFHAIVNAELPMLLIVGSDDQDLPYIYMKTELVEQRGQGATICGDDSAGTCEIEALDVDSDGAMEIRISGNSKFATYTYMDHEWVGVSDTEETVYGIIDVADFCDETLGYLDAMPEAQCYLADPNCMEIAAYKKIKKHFGCQY